MLTCKLFFYNIGVQCDMENTAPTCSLCLKDSEGNRCKGDCAYRKEDDFCYLKGISSCWLI